VHTTALLLSLQELLLIEMILDDRIKGKINQIDGYLELGDAKQTTRYTCIERHSIIIYGTTTAHAIVIALVDACRLNDHYVECAVVLHNVPFNVA
jgi:hypothetical protein